MTRKLAKEEKGPELNCAKTQRNEPDIWYLRTACLPVSALPKTYCGVSSSKEHKVGKSHLHNVPGDSNVVSSLV